MYNVSDSVISSHAFLELMQEMEIEPGALYPAIFSVSVMLLAYRFVREIVKVDQEDNFFHRCFRFGSIS